MEDQDDQTCLSAGISVSFQKHYSLLCQLGFSNHDAAEHLVLFCVQCSCHRSVIEKWNQVHSSRPVNAMQSLLYWPFSECYIVALTFLFIRLRHLLNSQVCQVYSEIETMPWASCTLITYIGTILNLTIISIDRYLAVRSVCQYRFWVTPASRPLRLYSNMSGFQFTNHVTKASMKTRLRNKLSTVDKTKPKWREIWTSMTSVLTLGKHSLTSGWIRYSLGYYKSHHMAKVTQKCAGL